eukprot:5355891-Karenia_brevis.AAC.1
MIILGAILIKATKSKSAAFKGMMPCHAKVKTEFDLQVPAPPLNATVRRKVNEVQLPTSKQGSEKFGSLSLAGRPALEG